MKLNISPIPITILCLLFWPLNLALSNTAPSLPTYFLPLFLILISYFLQRHKCHLSPAPLLAITLVSPKLALLPVIYTLVNFVIFRQKHHLFYFLFSLLLLGLNFKAFWGQTIFLPDYEARQEVIRNTHLYSNVYLPRLFHNKLLIRLDKFNFRLFCFLDPNNYFFGFQPRQIILDNQNLHKFPFLAVIPFTIGLFYLPRHKHKIFLTTLLASSFLSLSVLTNFDRHDLILWLPFSLILLNGIQTINRFRPLAKYAFYFFLTVFSVFELTQILTS